MDYFGGLPTICNFWKNIWGNAQALYSDKYCC